MATPPWGDREILCPDCGHRGVATGPSPVYGRWWLSPCGHRIESWWVGDSSPFGTVRMASGNKVQLDHPAAALTYSAEAWRRWLAEAHDIPPWVIGDRPKPRFARLRWVLRRWWSVW